MNVDSMMGQNHDLYHEFPEFAELIKELQNSDDKFAELCDHYTELNREVIRVEQHVEPVSHNCFEDLKKQRLHCKDLIYDRLRARH
ncbi:MAG: DUF465 domain-containing protein [Gammaproteobacteria bacterium]